VLGVGGSTRRMDQDWYGNALQPPDVVDWALVYPPHFGVNQDRVHANEPSLIEVASGWTS
jgi:hypothetical protein